MATSRVDQRNAQATRDVIAGDRNEYNIVLGPHARTIVPVLMERLAQEIKTNTRALELIEGLQFFHERHVPDGIDGLEKKLDHVGRQQEKSLALRKKELFARLLARYSLFDSAQQIFAHLLARADQQFRSYILPNLGDLSAAEIDRRIGEYIVDPIVEEVGAGEFSMNAHVVMGMVYWLAEQCYFRWHK